MLEPTALEVRLELLLHVSWQRPPVDRPLLSECRIVICAELIEQRRLGAMAPVARRLSKPLGLREVVRRRAHGLHPCDAGPSDRHRME
jgi:hypothetical protein